MWFLFHWKAMYENAYKGLHKSTEKYWNIFIKGNFFMIFNFSIRRNAIFSRMNTMFFNDTRNITSVFFGRWSSLLFRQKGNTFVGKRNTTFTKYTENIMFPSTFWERSSFIFRLKNKIVFPGEKPIFLDIIKEDYIPLRFFSERRSF